MTWGYYWCPHCKEQKKSNNDLFQYDGDTEVRTCNKAECSKKERDINQGRQEEQDKKNNELLGKLSKHMESGEDLDKFSTSWEQDVRLLPVNIQELCHKYQENCQERDKNKEELKKLKKELKRQQEQEEEEREICDDCNNKITGDVYYRDGKNKTGTSCYICLQVRKYKNKPASTSPPKQNNPPTTNNPSPSFFSPSQSNGNLNNNQEKCGVCDKVFDSNMAEEHSNQNPQCKSYANACTKILNGQAINYSEFDLSERGRIIVKALQELKIEKKWVDIDNLNLPQEAKEGLKKLRQQLGIEQKNDFGEERITRGLNTQGKIGVTLLSIVGFVIFLVILRKFRRKNKKITK